MEEVRTKQSLSSSSSSAAAAAKGSQHTCHGYGCVCGCSSSKPRPIHNLHRQINLSSSSKEPAAGRSLDDDFADNPYMNDEFMQGIMNTLKGAKKLSKGDLYAAGLNNSNDNIITPTPALERGSKVPAIPIQTSDPLTLTRGSSSDFRSMAYRASSHGKGYARHESGSMSKTNSSESLTASKQGKVRHRKSHSHTQNDVFLTDPATSASSDFDDVPMRNPGARKNTREGAPSPQNNHSHEHLQVKLSEPNRRRSDKEKDKTLRLERNAKRESLENLTDIGHIVVTREEDLFTASPGTLEAVSEGESQARRELTGDEWMKSGKAEELRMFMDNATSGAALSKARRNSANSRNRTSVLSSMLDDDFLLLEDGSMPLLQVLQAIERAASVSSTNLTRSRNISVETGSKDSTNQNHKRSIRSSSAEDQAAAILADANAEYEADVNRRRHQRQVDLAFDATTKQATKVLCTQRKKLILENMDLTLKDIPVNAICNKPLGKELHKLSLAGNKLVTVPDRLVLELHGLHTLDLQQCDIIKLPSKWNLKALRRLILSHNKLNEFLDEETLKGLPELRYLDMYDNKLCELILPAKGDYLSKLEFLNLGFNDLTCLPDDLTRLKKLRVIKVPNNLITHISKHVVDMDLKELEATPNPLIQPPLEDCERGICGMRRYYKCLASRSDFTHGLLSSPCSLQSADSSVVFSPAKGRRQLKKFHLSLMDNSIERVKKVVPAIFKGMHPKKDHPPRAHSAPANHQDHAVTGTVARKPKPLGAAISKAGGGVSQRQASTSSSTSLSSTEGQSLKHEAKVLSLATKEIASNYDEPHPRRRLTAITEPIKSDSFDTPNSSIRTLKASNKEQIKYEPTVDEEYSHSEEVRQISLDRPKEMSVALAAPPIEDTELHDADLKYRSQSMPLEIEREKAKVFDNEDVDYIWDTQEKPVSSTADVAVNDTLKIIFVGMAYTGKTSLIRRLIDGNATMIPKRDERTIGVDIYEWNPSKHDAHTGECIARLNTTVLKEEEVGGSSGTSEEVDVKFSVWDFAGQNVYHATHELFFSPRALYVLAWDMGINNKDTRRRKMSLDDGHVGPFSLSDSEDEDNGLSEREVLRAERALEKDIDEKVQFWVDCIQSSVPGAVILPVATFEDAFDAEDGGSGEARRRCGVMKKRLLQHEARRKEGIETRLAQMYKNKQANAETASRLRKLLCPMARPKLIFGIDKHDSVLRVSSTRYTGFCALRSKIVNIATGRDFGGTKYPMFRGHMGAIIPQMRLEVRDVVRSKRKDLRVVEWEYFLAILRETMSEEVISNHDDVSDALQFLSNIGELSYFGGGGSKISPSLGDKPNSLLEDISDDEDDEDNTKVLAIDDISSAPYLDLMDDPDSTDVKCSFSSIKPLTADCGLSEYVFLNPRWLVAVVACILRHDLRQAIDDTRRRLADNVDYQDEGLEWQQRGGFHSTYLNCPIITAEEATMLWKTKRVILKAAERSKHAASNSATMTTFEFLQKLLIRFNVLVPIDLNVEKAQFGGEQYEMDDHANAQDGETTPLVPMEQPKFFFLPSLLGPGTPSEQVWTYKCSEAFKTTLCVSWWFPDGCPPGLMERVNASVLRDIYATTQHGNDPNSNQATWREHQVGDIVGKLRVHEVLCWRSAFLLQLGMKNVINKKGDVRESLVEIFAHLVDQDDPMCVASQSMTIGTRRLVVSAKGQQGEGARKIWKGGYEMVTKAIERVVREYGGLEFEKEGICPECLQVLPVTEASVWNWTQVIDAARCGRNKMRCKRAHLVDTHLIGGFKVSIRQSMVGPVPQIEAEGEGGASTSVVPVKDLIGSVVLVALWDGKQKKILRVGSGFVVDNKRGLIVTASHTLIRMEGEGLFGEYYYGSKSAKALIGVIPKPQDSENNDPEVSQKASTAVFRYFAEIVADDVDNMDACVLKIKTKLEKDIEDDCDIASVQENPLLDKKDFKKEKISKLPVTIQAEVEEEVRVLGFNQGGEGLFTPGSTLNRVVDFAKGYVVRSFKVEESTRQGRRTFIPRHELVVNAPTIGGHSGGPCVNKLGEVVGILSRADPADKGRCYLVPTSEFMPLVEEAKKPKNNFDDLF